MTKDGGAARPSRVSRLLDALLVVGLTAVIESLVWTGVGPGDPITGPRPLMALLPLLIAMPLWWRRRFPLVVCTAVWLGILTEVLLSGHVHEGIEGVIAAGVAAYSAAAYGPRRPALVGLAVMAVGYTVRTWYDANFRSGRPSEAWAAAFFAVYLLALWLIGAVVQARRESAIAATRAAAVQREAQRAVAEERARIARDLHDIVSHNLSVVILQAAGGLAQGERVPPQTAATLEKIETSGREALTEMRRLLGVLRTDDGDKEPPALRPAPGMVDLEPLAIGVRQAGVDVALDLDTAGADLPPAVEISVYRIVQEALTNVLKHAGPQPHADVAVHADRDAVVVTVVDDGSGPASDAGLGHGLRGMRERVTLLGGQIAAGARAEGGFAVTARLPLGGPS